MKILIVDDSRLNLQYAKDVLNKNKINCEVETINSPLKALEIIRTKTIDIVLLDIIMPEMSGLELLEILRRERKFEELIILMFTSLSDKKNLQKSFELGANDYITKPIEEVEFISRIKAAMRIKSNQDEIATALSMLEKQNEQLKRTSIKLRETQFQLIQKEKLSAIGSLAGGIAHEINNPLGYLSSNYESLKKYIKIYKNAIKHYKDILFEMEKCKDEFRFNQKLINILEKEDIDLEELEFINSDIDELLNDSNDGINRVSKIVKGLLNFSNTDTNESMDFNNIGDIIDEVIAVLGNNHKNNINIKKRIYSTKKYLCNRGEITQVFFNIIQNSIQAINSQKKEASGNITTTIYEEKGYINCDIKDDGPGIRPEILNKIFNPFFTTKDVGDGTGLGLSICYDLIVNKYKGEIEVKSDINKGSTFTVKLPLKP